MKREEFISNKHLEFLDVLRESGITNMFGARTFLMDEYSELKEKEAGIILNYWMSTFKERTKERKFRDALATAAAEDNEKMAKKNGVTLTIKDNSKGGLMVSFDLPRLSMNEALEFITAKLKSWRK